MTPVCWKGLGQCNNHDHGATTAGIAKYLASSLERNATITTTEPRPRLAVWGLRFKVQGLKFKVEGFGFKV
jgi:hypothetical protein